MQSTVPLAQMACLGSSEVRPRICILINSPCFSYARNTLQQWFSTLTAGQNNRGAFQIPMHRSNSKWIKSLAMECRCQHLLKCSRWPKKLQRLSPGVLGKRYATVVFPQTAYQNRPGGLCKPRLPGLPSNLLNQSLQGGRVPGFTELQKNPHVILIIALKIINLKLFNLISNHPYVVDNRKMEIFQRIKYLPYPGHSSWWSW